MANFNTFYSLLFLVILSFFTITQAQNFGFTADLIHRDSPNSPLYNPLETPSQRIANAFRRSINRAKRFFPSAFVSTQAAQSDIIPDGGAYLMKITIGTPPVSIVAIADTGSDLIWTQCTPCDNCFQQKAPLFNPSKSLTYKDINCDSKLCAAVENTACGNGTCEYQMSYGDQSYTNGNVAVDTIALPSSNGKPVAFPNTIFGCGHDDSGTFTSGTSGIIGLGGGQVSLINQMANVVNGKFSYCLAPSLSNANSKINFGANAVVSGEGAMSTPLITKDIPTFYYLTLEGMSVGQERFELITKDSESSQPNGNVIIDSGTTLTLLPSDIYTQVESSIKKQIALKPTQDPSQQFSLCYEAQGDSLKAPVITAHFTGADIELHPLHSFIEVSEGLLCFAFSPMDIPTDSDVGGIFGNIAQTNFLVGYDLVKKTVTFKPTDCASGV